MAATSEHLSSPGTTLHYATNLSAPSYVEITDIHDVTPPGLEWGESKDTQLASPSAHRESGPGWISPKTMTFKTYWVQVQDSTLKALAITRVLLKWKVTLPKLSTEATAGATVIFNGWIKNWTPAQKADVDSDDRMMTDWEVQVTGVITLAAGS